MTIDDNQTEVTSAKLVFSKYVTFEILTKVDQFSEIVRIGLVIEWS